MQGGTSSTANRIMYIFSQFGIYIFLIAEYFSHLKISNVEILNKERSLWQCPGEIDDLLFT